MRIFSIEEAEELLPVIKEAMERVFDFNQMVKSTENDIGTLLNIWGEEVYHRNHVDNAYYLRLLSRQQELMMELRDDLKGIQRLGCFVKDIERGLVDFYFMLNGGLVFLCWRYGEERIRYWHPVSAGFSGRKPIADLFAVQKR